MRSRSRGSRSSGRIHCEDGLIARARLGFVFGGRDRLGPGRNREDDRGRRAGHHPRDPGKIAAHPDLPADTRHQYARPAAGAWSARCANTSISPARRRNSSPGACVRHRRLPRRMLPPYFKALKKLTEEGAYQWDAPGPHGRRGLSQASRGRGVPRVFRREHHACRHRHLECRARLLARHRRTARRIAAHGRARVRRGLDLLRARRSSASNRIVIQAVRRHGRDGRRRPQLPQVAESRDDARRARGRSTSSRAAMATA